MVNKTTLTIFDGAGTIFGLDFIINKTSKRECLLCKTNLDKEIGEGKWHIPLCKKHRLKEKVLTNWKGQNEFVDWIDRKIGEEK